MPLYAEWMRAWLRVVSCLRGIVCDFYPVGLIWASAEGAPPPPLPSPPISQKHHPPPPSSSSVGSANASVSSRPLSSCFLFHFLLLTPLSFIETRRRVETAWCRRGGRMESIRSGRPSEGYFAHRFGQTQARRGLRLQRLNTRAALLLYISQSLARNCCRFFSLLVHATPTFASSNSLNKCVFTSIRVGVFLLFSLT